MGEKLQYLGGNVRVDHGPAAVDHLDGVFQLVHGYALEQVAAGAVFQGIEHILVVVKGGQNHNFDLRVRLFDELGTLDAVHFGHPNVHQNHIGPLLADALHDLLAVGSHTDHL